MSGWQFQEKDCNSLHIFNLVNKVQGLHLAQSQSSNLEYSVSNGPPPNQRMKSIYSLEAECCSCHM